MKSITRKKKLSSLLIFIFFILFTSFFLTTLNLANRFAERDIIKNPTQPLFSAQETFTALWLENSNFESGIDPWYSEIAGDINDVNATISSGQANFEILGENRTFSDISGTPQAQDWIEFNHSIRPLPLTHEINQYGLNVSHAYDEGNGIAPNSGDQTANLAGVLWKRNITMPVDMSDYIITSASISAIVNGSADRDIETPNDTPILDSGYASLFDHAFFYVEISDLQEIEAYQIASYRTDFLGNGQESRTYVDYSTRDNLTNTLMVSISESDLIFYLNQILEHDPYNFTITLGIEVDSEDNYPGFELDYWYSLLIKSCNFSFTYEKKIDQFTTVSWKQDGDQISDISNDTIIVEQAKLNFNYKIDSNWTDLSPNSEIRVFINNNKLTETIKLNTANSSFQEAKLGGYDVTSLIPYNTEINISIQVYIADQFNLDKIIILSIDDVFLNITYTVTFPDTQTNLQLFFNGQNRTLNPIFDLPISTDLNITIKYPDNNGSHISGAIVQLSGNLTGTLIEDLINEQYTLIIQGNEFNLGTIYFEVIARRVNYETRKVSPILTISKIPAENLQLYLNQEDKTTDPYYQIAVNKLLNITVKYKDVPGNHISGASLQLVGEGILEDFNESVMLEQYSIVINTSIKLSLGENDLTIVAQEDEHQTKTLNPRLTVRKIITHITPASGSNTIDIFPGKSVTIRIYINDTDFNTLVKGAIVTYVWEFGDGILLDPDNDGIYEGIIDNIPEGTHQINISAFGSNIYSFESFIVTISAYRPVENTILFQVLLAIGIIASIALGGYVYAYQKVLKYPKSVRKVLKFRRTLRKTNAPHVDIISRDKAFQNAYKTSLGNSMKFLKTKPSAEQKFKDSMKKTTEKAPRSNEKPPTKNKSEEKSLDKPFNKQNSLKSVLKGRLRNIWHKLVNINAKYRFMKLIIIIFGLVLNTILLNHVFNPNSVNRSDDSLHPMDYEKEDKLSASGQESYTKQWLNNTAFNGPVGPTWFPLIGTLGDNTDVNATTTPGQANFEVLGTSRLYNNISGAPQPAVGWQAFNNSYFIEPDYHNITATGAVARHTFDENIDQSRNRPSIHWRRNITMPVNMSEYLITSVNLSAEVSGRADTNVETPFDDLSFDGAGWSATYYDNARFYIKVSNLDYENLYEIAFFQNMSLGEGDQTRMGTGVYTFFNNSLMNVIDEEILIFYLTRALEQDFFNFGITLGIDIYCEDNYNALDRDTFSSLRFNSFNLSFAYEKKIDKLSSASWNQNADKISSLSNDTIVVNQALLNFKYKINDTWPSSSPNSEIRILINDNQHSETIKLSNATGTFQVAKSGGFDVTSLITDDVNLSIQLFLADDFGLNRTIMISIDDVTLNISYTIIFPDFETDLHLFLNKANKTDDLNFNLNVGEQLNITIKYLNNSGAHIPNATVNLSGNFTGTLVENATLEQYSIIIDTDITNIGINFLTVTAKLDDYELKVINPLITINKLSSENLQILFNSNNVTLDPSIELVFGEELNITIKYTDLTGSHIPNATVRLISEGLTRDLNESLVYDQYSLILNTTERLIFGVNLLTIEAQEPNFLTGYAFLRVTVRRVNVEIDTLTGLDTLETKTGNDVTIRVNLNNTDLEGLITGAIVTYTWENGDGILTDTDNDGIYETTLLNFPNGTYTFEISAFAGDEYFIEDYELIIVGISESAGPPIFQILAIISAVIIAGLASYLYVYQKYLRFPKAVRKVRKYRKSLKRNTKPSTNIIGREKAINSLYKEELNKTSNILKVKPPVSRAKSGLIEKLPPRYTQISEPKKLKLDTDKLIDKSLEKKAELDKIIDKSTKDSSP